MSEEKEKYVEPIRSKLFMDIFKIVKKLNLVKTDKDDYDHLSVTYELEKLYNKLEQQKAELIGALSNERDKLYNNLPSGDIKAWDLLIVIKNHIANIDELLRKHTEEERDDRSIY